MASFPEEVAGWYALGFAIRNRRELKARAKRALAPAAGWYADPWGLTELRYFDGYQWTAATN